MQTKIDRVFIYSAGALLLLAATALLVSTWTPAYYIQYPHDPVFGISIRTLFWLVAGICFTVSLICLFGKNSKWQAALVAYLATGFGIYWLGLYWGGGGNLSGYFANFPTAFGISASAACVFATMILGYLFLGGYLCLIWLWRQERLENAVESRKMLCPACGGHIKFAAQNVGRQIDCPHCKTTIVLQTADTLKMTCVLCGGNIEFPAHSLGQKIPCPHCAKIIPLLKPA